MPQRTIFMEFPYHYLGALTCIQNWNVLFPLILENDNSLVSALCIFFPVERFHATPERQNTSQTVGKGSLGIAAGVYPTDESLLHWTEGNPFFSECFCPSWLEVHEEIHAYYSNIELISVDQCNTSLHILDVLLIKEPVAIMHVSWGTADRLLKAWSNCKLPLQYLSQELTFHAGRIRKYLFMNHQKLFTSFK